MADTATLEKPKLKVTWTDDEITEQNRHIGGIFVKIDDKEANRKKVRYSPTSSFPRFCDENGTPTPDGAKSFVPRYNIEMFTWKNGKNPGGDEKNIQLNKVAMGQFFIDCELFLKNYQPE